MQRQTSYLLVILKHEKPIKDLPDVIADRLSKMEGVDGSGVIVSQFDGEAGKDFIVRAEAIENARYSGDAVEELQSAIDFEASHVTAQERDALNLIASRMTPFKEQRTVVDSTPINKDNLSREQFEKTARLLTKGIGENITT